MFYLYKTLSISYKMIAFWSDQTSLLFMVAVNLLVLLGVAIYYLVTMDWPKSLEEDR